MNSIEKYKAFIANDFNVVEEQDFAEALASNAEFRVGFKNYLKLTKSLNESSNYFAPTPELKGSVFSALGFGAGAATPTPKIEKKKNFKNSKLLLVAITALLTSGLTLLLVNTFPGIENNSANSTISGDSHNTTTGFDYSKNASSTPISHNVDESDNSSAVTKPELKANIANNKTTDSIAFYGGALESTNVNLNKNNIVDISSAYQTKQTLNLITDTNIKPQTSINQDLSATPDISTASNLWGVNFEFMNTPSWFKQSPNVEPFRSNRFNNLSLNASVTIFDNLNIGVGFRQETFFVDYTGFNSYGDLTRFYQQPNLTSYGINLRYYPIQISESFKPFAQMEFAGNTAGTITREKIGLEYSPAHNIYFQLGGEYSQLYFTHDNSKFTASKFSLNYGIGVKF